MHSLQFNLHSLGRLVQANRYALFIIVFRRVYSEVHAETLLLDHLLGHLHQLSLLPLLHLEGWHHYRVLELSPHPILASLAFLWHHHRDHDLLADSR